AVLLAIAAPAALADTVIVTPAPPSSAEATAVKVDDLVAVGDTRATAGPADSAPDGTATGNALELGGNPPATPFGGTPSGTGSKHGALIDTGNTPVGRLAVTPWSASVGNAGDTTDAAAEAALLQLWLGPLPSGGYLASADVLRSASNAHYTPLLSSASSNSDG